ncbi:hypothetical protein P153DRAFT_281487 [Dothidotthia symphoricarpi CBS 119687]|uniref:Uncharacterized protein n=1 Tax=Dothidotthia symphoricarpi CBS 119687 TaxID=1392245 RepID=A0A6A6AQW6_9PLEO|nr:uncharacterized protein P153DRAFT_281487 [Dothidotthia symphoricarpi CBS 119687]KAF2134190.1 hypothetical protein P153DRAFT_281487 [Dothidotthia symphoricarpi CBS 119687]
MVTTHSKLTVSTLKTPLSATYPSELRSPMVHSATTPIFANIKREDMDLKTPITPPSAYLDFLKTFSPILMSPMSASTNSKFVFEGNRPTSVTSSTSSASFTSTCAPAEKSSPKESPATSRSSSCSRCEHSKEEPPMSAPPTKVQTVTIPPPSPFTRPQSARTPRLYIPPSPYSPAVQVQSPGSAKALNSPFSAASPKTWEAEQKTGRARSVSVRKVVTRTVTYSSTPVDKKAPHFPQIDPAPRGKRRKIE